MAETIIIQGTSPVLLLRVGGHDLTDAQTIWVSIDCNDKKNIFILDRSAVEMDGEDSICALHLSQRNTLALDAGTAELQIRWKNASGEVQATVVETIEIAKLNYKGVM